MTDRVTEVAAMLASLGQNVIKSIPKKLETSASFGLHTQSQHVAFLLQFTSWFSLEMYGTAGSEFPRLWSSGLVDLKRRTG